jgi:hypothetical protein
MPEMMRGGSPEVYLTYKAGILPFEFYCDRVTYIKIAYIQVFCQMKMLSSNEVKLKPSDTKNIEILTIQCIMTSNMSLLLLNPYPNKKKL